ncbi:Uncharacterised protein [Mycobacteroides abscessus subsp. abscessus]|nr:Uncharacterised protein [Mycobacteroides abscessus subsp. abscessus]
MWAEPTSTPRCATSSRKALAKCSTAALEALYAVTAGEAA